MAQEMLTSLGPFRSREPVLLLLFPSSESRVPAFSTVVAENETLTKTGLGFKTPLGPKTAQATRLRISSGSARLIGSPAPS
jgi:hypothetical protein